MIVVEQDEVEEKLDRALEKLVDNDAELIDIDVNERTLTHRLAIYIEEEFPDLNVDCEYNRKDGDPKRIRWLRPCNQLYSNLSPDDTITRTVYPDIIVHRRMGQQSNLLVVEVKKSSNKTPDECNLSKLQELKKDPGYAHAAFIKIRTDGTMDERYHIKFVQGVNS